MAVQKILGDTDKPNIRFFLPAPLALTTAYILINLLSSIIKHIFLGKNLRQSHDYMLRTNIIFAERLDGILIVPL